MLSHARASLCAKMSPRLFNIVRLFVAVVLLLFLTNLSLYFRVSRGSSPFTLPNVQIPSVDDAAVEQLLRAWVTIYNLESNASNCTLRAPILPVVNGTRYPLAPHLQDCFRLTEERKKLDGRKGGKSLPDWAIPSPGKLDFKPPWIQGSDADNLAYTRFIQAKMWITQFPEDCSDPKHIFAYIPYHEGGSSGLGSKIHILAYQLWLAHREGRIAVFIPGTFDKMRIPSCAGEDHGSLSCFFFKSTSTECERVAAELWKKKTGNVTVDRIRELSDSPYMLEVGFTWLDDRNVRPWHETPISMELYGELVAFGKQIDEIGLSVEWHHVQATRFLLRFPSAFLCHVMNRVRHEAFGRHTARMVLEAEAARVAMSRSARANERDIEALLIEAEASFTNGSGKTLEEHVWWQSPPYMPRPMVSLFVRVGDKKIEMRVASLGSYMYLVEKLRRHVPNAKHIWLNTESEEIIEKSKQYVSRWTIFYAKNKRLGKGNSLDNPERYEDTAVSLASLMIACESDYYVGPLASNSARIINELRLTTGKQKIGYLILNFGNW